MWLIWLFVGICVIVGLSTFIILTIQNKCSDILYDDEDTLQNLAAALYSAICWPIVIVGGSVCAVILFLLFLTYICTVIFYLIEKIVKHFRFKD